MAAGSHPQNRPERLMRDRKTSDGDFYRQAGFGTVRLEIRQYAETHGIRAAWAGSNGQILLVSSVLIFKCAHGDRRGITYGQNQKEYKNMPDERPERRIINDADEMIAAKLKHLDGYKTGLMQMVRNIDELKMQSNMYTLLGTKLQDEFDSQIAAGNIEGDIGRASMMAIDIGICTVQLWYAQQVKEWELPKDE